MRVRNQQLHEQKDWRLHPLSGSPTSLLYPSHLIIIRVNMLVPSLELASETFHDFSLMILAGKSHGHRAYRPRWARAEFQKVHGHERCADE